MKYLTLFALIASLFVLSNCSKDDDPAPLPLPTPPTDLIGTTISDTEIRLDWIDNSDSEEGFIINRDHYPIDTVDANVTSYNDTGLVSLDYYSYAVYAYNSDHPYGEYAYSGKIWTFGRPVINPWFPSYISSTAIGSIFYTNDDGGQPILEHGVIWDLNDDPDTTAITKSKQGPIDKGEFTYYDITGLMPNTKYYLRGYAINSIGLSYSYSYTVTTFE